MTNAQAREWHGDILPVFVRAATLVWCHHVEHRRDYMTKMVVLLTEGFADWETGLLSAVARGFYGVDVVQTTMLGSPVTSSGGLNVTPGVTLAEALVGADALVLCGGAAWRAAPPDVTVILQGFGGVIAGICDATRALAGAGVLDSVAHTSNDAGTLDVPGYRGAARFIASPAAVRDGRIVTAPGTAPSSFMSEVLAALGLADDNLRFYLGMLGAEHTTLPKAA
jgi:putative intracellular protease/amidase